MDRPGNRCRWRWVGSDRGVFLWGVLVAVCLPLSAGCVQDDLSLAPVEGVVTLDGGPVADAGVTFQPVAKGPNASGTTDAKGYFHLTTANKLGALLGEHRVVIGKTETDLPRGPDGQVDESKLRELTEIEEINYLPVRYSDPGTSELRAEVKSVSNNFTFSLTSDKTVAAADKAATDTDEEAASSSTDEAKSRREE